MYARFLEKLSYTQILSAKGHSSIADRDGTVQSHFTDELLESRLRNFRRFYSAAFGFRAGGSG